MGLQLIEVICSILVYILSCFKTKWDKLKYSLGGILFHNKNEKTQFVHLVLEDSRDDEGSMEVIPSPRR